MRILTDSYQQWQILIHPQTEDRWSFNCFPPECDEPLQNDKSYDSPEEAIAAAKVFIEKRAARNQLSELLGSLLESKQIDSKDYNKALELITRLALD
jgi:hypothetical protein